MRYVHFYSKITYTYSCMNVFLKKKILIFKDFMKKYNLKFKTIN